MSSRWLEEGVRDTGPGRGLANKKASGKGRGGAGDAGRPGWWWQGVRNLQLGPRARAYRLG